MRRVPYSRYYLPPPPWAGPRVKPKASTYDMSPEEAQKRGALGVVPGTTNWRDIPETEDEMPGYHSAGRDGPKSPGQ